MRRLIPAAALLLLLASCGGEQSDAAPSTRGPVASTSQFARVTEEQGLVTITFTENGETLELFGDPRESGKRKYTLGENEAVLYEVKPNDEGGFKLRTPDGNLRWKVKVTPEKVKISDNEENDRPFELKVRDGDRVKVVAPGDRELGNVRYASGKLDVEDAAGKSIFSLNAPKFAGAYGVLLLDGVPDRERYIILAELLSRGR